MNHRKRVGIAISILCATAALAFAAGVTNRSSTLGMVIHPLELAWLVLPYVVVGGLALIPRIQRLHLIAVAVAGTLVVVIGVKVLMPYIFSDTGDPTGFAMALGLTALFQLQAIILVAVVAAVILFAKRFFQARKSDGR